MIQRRQLNTLFIALSFLVVCLKATSVFARGDEMLNGGDVILCNTNAGGFTEEVLDLYEGREVFGFQYATIPGNSVDEFAEALVRRIDRLNPTRAARYRQYLREFQSEAKFVPRSLFKNLQDEGWAAYPKDCELRQAVLQYDHPAPSGIRYVINQDLWSRLSNFNKASLMLHEVIYREGRLAENDFQSSARVRYFNALIHSKDIESMSLSKYVDHIRYVGFQETDAGGFPLQLFRWNQDHSFKTPLNIEFHSEAVVASGTLGAQFSIPGISWTDPYSCTHSAVKESTIRFFESGKVLEISLGCQSVRHDFETKTGHGMIRGNQLLYSETGSLETVVAEPNIMQEDRWLNPFNYNDGVHFYGVKFTPSVGRMTVSFTADGLLSEVTVTHGSDWSGPENSRLPAFGAILKFDRDGHLIDPSKTNLLPSP